ncbi:3'-5' RNA exonuclease complex component [Coniothyrium glycines]
MPPRPLSLTGAVCLRCQWRLMTRHPGMRTLQNLSRLSTLNVSTVPRRTLHAAANRPQLEATTASATQTADPLTIPYRREIPFRLHLEKWQAEYGGPSEETLLAFQNHPALDEIGNDISKLSTGLKADQALNQTEWEYDVEDDGEEELMTLGLFLKPGDVVQLKQSGHEPVLAVFVQQLERDSQFFSVNGRWTHAILSSISFAIQGCIEPALLEKILPYLPTDPSGVDKKSNMYVPAEFAAPVLEELERLSLDAEKIYRTNATALDSAYDVLADRTRSRMMTLTQIAKTLLARGDPAWVASPAALLAVRKALNQNQFRFRSDSRSQRLTNIFVIRSKDEVKNVETVHGWVREYQEYLAVTANHPQKAIQTRNKGVTYIAEFLAKARTLIASSRRNRDIGLGSVGPDKTRKHVISNNLGMQAICGEAFTSTDQQIINFLHAFALGAQFNEMAGLYSACTAIIQATDCYGREKMKHLGVYYDILKRKQEIGRPAAMLFLQELGVVTPYENRYLYDERLMLPTTRLSRNMELLTTKAELARQNPGFDDCMAALRKDWGPTTVFCIDDADAQEIDDGISVERIDKDNAEEFWIHVHVANPTAFFDKTHTLSGLAAHITQTVYLPERTYPMLPKWASQGFFSLAPDRPSITFSTRINTQGQTLESKIQHGIIRNVVTVTNAEVASILEGNTTPPKITRLVVGGEVPTIRTQRPALTISSDQMQELRDMKRALEAVWRRRTGGGGVDFPNSKASVRLFENANHAGLQWMSPSIDQPREIVGDPIIEMTATPSRGFWYQDHFTSRDLVAEAMLLAGATVADWCSVRHIPVMFRGTIHPCIEGETSASIRDETLAYLQEHGRLPEAMSQRYIKSLGRGIAHSAPIAHNMLGIPAYVKATSPLRRFSDMIAHWQIEAAIRYEGHTGKTLDVNDLVDGGRGVLPFSQRQIQESIVTLGPREWIISRTQKSAQVHWALLALYRAVYYENNPLTGFWTCYVNMLPQTSGRAGNDFLGPMGHMTKLGVKACILSTDEKMDIRLGDEWEVELDTIDLWHSAIYVKAVRLLTRESESGLA